MAKIKEPEARVAYLALGPDRSLEKLYRHYADTIPNAPALVTIKGWSRNNDWVRLANEHDAKVATRATARAQTKNAKEMFDTVSLLDGAIEIALDAAGLRVAAAQAADKGDFAGMVKAAVEAAKMREVLTGGVSERTESKSDVTVRSDRVAIRQRLADLAAGDKSSDAPLVGQEPGGGREAIH